jgi:hypothetical protein
MLRITTFETEKEKKWFLKGRLAGRFVLELTSSWISSRQGHTSVVDLTDVTFIDRAGAKVLCAMQDAGVRFIAHGAAKPLFDEADRMSWWTGEKEKVPER